jgi:hypothetical protein
MPFVNSGSLSLSLSRGFIFESTVFMERGVVPVVFVTTMLRNDMIDRIFSYLTSYFVVLSSHYRKNRTFRWPQ